MGEIMKKILIIIICCLASCVLYSCDKQEDQQQEVKQFTSNEMSYAELTEAYSKLNGLAVNEVEKRFQKAQIDETLSSYRILSVPLENNKLQLNFIAITQGENHEWQLSEIKLVEIRSFENRDESFFGNIAYWVRDKNNIEYDVNGSFFLADSVIEMYNDIENKNGMGVFTLPLNETEVDGNGTYVHIHKTSYF